MKYLDNYWMGCLKCGSDIHVSLRMNHDHLDVPLILYLEPDFPSASVLLWV